MPRRQPRGAAGPLDRRGGVAVAARRGSARCRSAPARSALEPDGQGRLRIGSVQSVGVDGGRLVRGRQVGRPAARPAHRGRSLARVRLRAAGAAARGARLRRGAPRAGLRPTARARQRASLRAPARRRLAARDARPAQPLPPPLARRAGAARAGRGGRGHGDAGLDRAPLPGRLAAAPERLAVLLAARLAVARAGHAHARRGTGAALVLPVRAARGTTTRRLGCPTSRRSRRPTRAETLHSGRGARTVERDLGTAPRS